MKRFQKNIKLYVGLALLALASSCKPEITKEFGPVNSSSVNFSKYIAVGNSLTAGFADGGLYLEGQQVAFPNLVAEQMKSHGGGEFNTPFFSEAQSNGSGYIRLAALENGRPVTENVTEKLAYTAPNVLAKYSGSEIHNLGVPGMRLDHSGQGIVSAANMYFARLLPDTDLGRVSYQDFVDNRNHTFFSFWLGNNDVLGYATNGAVDDNPAGTTALTSVAVFKAVYTQFINKLTANGQKGVIATIPDVTNIPYLTTVTRQALLDAASQAAGTTIENLYIATKTGPRAATDQDLFVLPFSSAGLLGKPNTQQIPYGFHPLNPIEDKYVLDEAEVQNLRTHINELNKFITEIGQQKNLAVADVNALLSRLKTGIIYNGVAVSSAFVTGNAFSLDGIHLTPMGNAIMANLIIDAINAKYGTKLEKIDATNYRGVKMP